MISDWNPYQCMNETIGRQGIQWSCLQLARQWMWEFDPNTDDVARRTNPGTKADTIDGATEGWLTFRHLRDLLLEGPPNVRFVRARFPVDAIVLVMEEEEEEEDEDELVYPYPFLCPFQWVIALHIVCWSA